jgi:HPt (histidine-containing phosphotransfer) domain-containing protein
VTERTGEGIRIQIDDELADLIPGYLENRRKDIHSILEALRGGDHEAIRYLGHSMKGSGGGYGFQAITDIGRAIETAAQEGNAEEIRVHVEALMNYLDRIEIVYA